MKILSNLEFNKEPAYFMHIDLNSCFATIEQQANPLLRNRPIGVAAYDSPGGIILAPSVEAKKLGIKLGFTVRDAKKICPDIKILTPDPEKYRYVHRKLKQLLENYTNEAIPKSIDEFVLNFKNIPLKNKSLIDIGSEIKKRIKSEVGDYITVSVGISKNRFLAKTASNLKKPDGLEEINEANFMDIYKRLKLEDLTGIGVRTATNLNGCGIYTVEELYNTRPYELKTVFKSVLGYYWYLKLRGYEIENYKNNRKSFGHQYSLPKPMRTIQEIRPILTKLIEKMGYRLRNAGYKTQGLQLYMYYKDHTGWHFNIRTKKPIFDSQEIYKEMVNMFYKSPQKEIKLLGVACFNLSKIDKLQLELFNDVIREVNLSKATDTINNRWGKFVIVPANMITKEKYIPDRIGFNSV